MKKITLSNIEHFIELFDDNQVFNDIEWVEPIFIAMLRAYQEDKKMTIQSNNTYIRNMIFNKYRKGSTYSPIETIENNRMGLEKISNHLTMIILENFKGLDVEDKRDLEHYLQYLFLEVMNNVADHAHSPVGGYTMAQYYPTNKKIQFTVADRGVAFLANMKLNFNDIKNEEEAIFKALKKGITSTQQQMYGQHKNAGFGLYAMFEILKMTGGKFVIISNDTLLRYENKNFEVKNLKTPWKGVVVSFEFFEANIEFDMDYFKREYLWKIEEDDEDYF